MVVIKKQSLRSLIGILCPFLFIPLAVILGFVALDGKHYMLCATVVSLLTVLLFVSGFEKKSIGTRRLVIVSVMVALSVVGRLIPVFKPLTAITVICAVYLGKESGFTVGAFSVLISNFYVGQGPWTPFQMLALGLIGLFAGYLSRLLSKSRAALLVYGTLSGVFYSALMDLWTVLGLGEGLTFSVYTAALITAIPHTLIYTVSNVAFLLLLAKPFGEKLERINVKYGL